MEIHLDLVGGLAGDMFIAALLDAFPQHELCVTEAIALSSEAHPVDCSLLGHHDHVLRGRRFLVRERLPPATVRAPFAPSHASHVHTTWGSIRSRLERSPLAAEVRSHALGIFALLAEAEAHVHGVAADSVEFHEVGAWDSIADIVGAAALIEAVGATRWTASAAPLGSGRVRTAHGILAIPAPATTRLLMGMPTIDDGVAGERVTPTGAAILRYLCPPAATRQHPSDGVRTLTAAGTGFGTRIMAGISNHVRVLCFEDREHSVESRRTIEVLEFEIDDQSGEDLATGLDRLRTHPAVLDVTQSAVFGKKGRMMIHVQVLARAFQLEAVAEACFRETTTIGLRHRSVQRMVLTRTSTEAEVDGLPLRVKVVDRPGGRTAKTESDDVLTHENHAHRSDLRARAESAVLGERRTMLGERIVELDA